MKASKGELYFENDRLMINQDLKSDIEKLRDICPAKALTVAGENKSIDDILKAIEKDMPFYSNSNGGVTLTGGEPFAQNGYLLDLVEELKAKDIDIAVETSLHMPWERIKPYVGLIDCWLVDLKHVDSDKFKKYTGGSAELVMANFHKLDASNANMIVRIPVIPGFNHTFSEMQQIIDFADNLQSVSEVHFILYHALGEGKYQLMGLDYQYKNHKPLHSMEMEDIIEYSKSKGLQVKIGG